MDFFEGRVAEMDGEFLNRVSLELATSLMALLNIAEQKRSQPSPDGGLN